MMTNLMTSSSGNNVIRKFYHIAYDTFQTIIFKSWSPKLLHLSRCRSLNGYRFGCYMLAIRSSSKFVTFLHRAYKFRFLLYGHLLFNHFNFSQANSSSHSKEVCWIWRWTDDWSSSCSTSKLVKKLEISHVQMFTWS